MSISIGKAPGSTSVGILAVHGALDASNYQDLIAAARELYEGGTSHIVLDMSDLSFMSSSGIVALHSIALLLAGQAPPNPEHGWAAIHAAGRIREGSRQQHLKLVNPQPPVRQTLDKVGLSETFEIYDDVAAAVASF